MILLGWPLVVLATLVAVALAIVLPCLHPSLPHSSTILSGVVSLRFFAQLSSYAPDRGVLSRVDRDKLIYLSCRSLSRLNQDMVKYPGTSPQLGVCRCGCDMLLCVMTVPYIRSFSDYTSKISLLLLVTLCLRGVSRP